MKISIFTLLLVSACGHREPLPEWFMEHKRMQVEQCRNCQFIEINQCEQWMWWRSHMQVCGLETIN